MAHVLTRPELRVLLNILRAREVIGIDPRDCRVDDEATFTTGRDRLERRGYLRRVPGDPHRVILDPNLMISLALCASARRVIATTGVGKDGAPRTLWHYLAGARIAVRRLLEPHQQQHVAELNDADEMWEAIADWLGLPKELGLPEEPEAPRRSELRVSRDEFNEIRRSLEHGGADATIRELRARGLSAPDAGSLVKALTKSTGGGTVSILRLGEQRQQLDVVVFLGVEGPWVLEPEPHASQRLYVRPQQRRQIVQVLRARLDALDPGARRSSA